MATIAYLISFLIVSAGPIYVVTEWPNAIGNFIDHLITSAAQHEIDVIALYFVASVLFLILYSVKKNYRASYGAIELFIALLTIADALSRIRSNGGSTELFVQLFAAFYVAIDGSENVDKGIEDIPQNSPIRQTWERQFSKKALPVTILTYLMFFSFFILLPIGWYTWVFLILLLIARDVVIDRLNRSPP